MTGRPPALATETTRCEGPPGDRLRAFHLRRRRASTLISVAMFMQSFVFGSSVIVGDLALYVFPAPPGSPYAWNGIIAVACSTAAAYYVGIELWRPLFARWPGSQRPVSIVCVLLSPAGYAVAGAAVSAHSVALLYVAWVGVLGVSSSVFDIWTRNHILGWWAVDGTARSVARMARGAGGRRLTHAPAAAHRRT